MTATRTLGALRRSLPPVLTEITIEARALDLVVEWRRCGILADHLADYLALSFEHQGVAQSVLSTVANELVENAVKFSADKAQPIRIAARHRGDQVEIESRNLAEPAHVAALESLFADLGRGDLPARFAERVEREQRGGLGLLILAKDYGAELSAELAPGGPHAAVTLRAVLSTKELEHP